MNRKMNVALVLLLAFTGMVMAEGFASCSKKDGGAASGGSENSAASDTPKREPNGQYRIGSKVKVYDGNFKPTDAYFAYSPSQITNLEYDNVVILNFGPPYIDAALFFGKANASDNIGLLRHCVDKSIEWATTAKQNNIHSLIKEIPQPDGYDLDDATAAYGLNQPNYHRHEPVYLAFSFYIGDIDKNGKEETLLIMNYLTHNEVRNMSQGHYFCFLEDDFVRLKEMFSEPYLAEIDRQEAEWQKSQTEQDTLFE